MKKVHDKIHLRYKVNVSDVSRISFVAHFLLREGLGIKKRILSALLAALLPMTMVPVTAFAKTPRDEISAQAEEIATTGTSSVGVLLSKALTEERQERRFICPTESIACLWLTAE